MYLKVGSEATAVWETGRGLGWLLMRRPTALLILLTLVVAGCASSKSGRTGEAKPEEINARKAEAQAYMDAGDYGSAITTLLPLAQSQVKNSQLYAMLAESYWRLGDYDSAVENYESALRIHFGAADIHLDFATMLMGMGRVGRALTEFELAVQYGDRDPLTHYNYGLALFDLGRSEEALAHWELAHSLDETNPRYAEALAIGLSGRDDRKALLYFERAAGLGANNAAFRNNYGLALQRAGEMAGAESQFKHALELEPDNPHFKQNLALVYMSSKKFELAIPLWQSLLDGDAANRTARIYLGRALYETERYAEAVSVLEEWVGSQAEGGKKPSDNWSKFDEPDPAAVGPGLDEAYDTLAMSYRGLGDLDKAEHYIALALAVAPESTIHLNNYGVILAENGKIEEAKVQWQKVLTLEPENSVAKQNLSAVNK